MMPRQIKFEDFTPRLVKERNRRRWRAALTVWVIGTGAAWLGYQIFTSYQRGNPAFVTVVKWFGGK